MNISVAENKAKRASIVQIGDLGLQKVILVLTWPKGIMIGLRLMSFWAFLPSQINDIEVNMR